MDETDRRARLIFLTQAGHEAVAEIRTVLAEAEAALLRDLSDAELDAIIDAFNRIGKRLQPNQDQP